MATKRDLVEAHSFHRRRLVTAFVSGAPGGREVEPARPGRSIVGGVALSVLLVAGAAVTGVFTDRPDGDWDSPGLVISKERGAAYVILEEAGGPEGPGGSGDLPELRPVINITSAQLLLGAEGLEPRIVPQATIDTRPLGEDIGILDAPASLPTTDDLLDSGWTACTASERGLTVRVSAEPRVVLVGGSGAALVEVGGPDAGLWLVATAPADADDPAQAHRYSLPAGDTADVDGFLRAVGFGEGTSAAVRVPREWLDLFPRGGDLTVGSFGLQDLGAPAPGQPDGVRVGDVESSGEGGFLVGDDGRLQPLTLFAHALWSTLDPGPAVRGGRPPRERRLEGASAEAAHEQARWPRGPLVPVVAHTCALLDAAPGRAPLVRLASSPGPDASADRAPDPAERLVDVDPGAGAYVVSGPVLASGGTPARAPGTTGGSTDVGDAGVGGAGGRRFVVDQEGRVHALVGDDTPGLLGYGSYEAPVVPSAWLDLFAPGVALSQEAALCPPQPAGAESSCG